MGFNSSFVNKKMPIAGLALYVSALGLNKSPAAANICRQYRRYHLACILRLSPPPNEPAHGLTTTINSFNTDICHNRISECSSFDRQA